MADDHALWTIVGDLIEISRLQAKRIESRVTRVEQVTTRAPEAHQFAVVVSEPAESDHRLKPAASGLESKR